MNGTRRKSRSVNIGGVIIGGDAAIAVQTMTNTPTTDVAATVRQIYAIADLGGQIVRVAVPTLSAIEALAAIIVKSPLPVVADIHFDWRIALAAIKVGAAKIRINPGNLSAQNHDPKNLDDGIKQIIAAARARQIPIRIGVNGGSIKHKNSADPRSINDALVGEALAYAARFADENFYALVLSLKTSSVADTILVNRLIAEKCDYPLHIGVTEAGLPADARLKSAIALGGLLLDGIGDTLRVSFTGKPEDEVIAGFDILRAAGILHDRPELIACPTCGRCRAANLPQIAEAVRARFSELPRPLKIAVMGCEVNGPGEAAQADYGLAACANGFWLFAKGKKIKMLPPEIAVDELFFAIANETSIVEAIHELPVRSGINYEIPKA